VIRLDNNAWLSVELVTYMSGSSGWQDLPKKLLLSYNKVRNLGADAPHLVVQDREIWFRRFSLVVGEVAGKGTRVTA
jgi:hypothetical protein